MPTWEYKVIRLRALNDQEEALNALGQERWELIAVEDEVNDPKAYFKRESVLPALTRERLAELAASIPESTAPTSMVGAHVTLRVSGADDPAVDGWVDTGLDLDEECAGMSVSIDGEVLASSGEVVGPEGSPEKMALNPVIGEELPLGCLIARVGEKGTVEPVYYSGFLATEDKGRIFLAVNDESYESNEGEFTVTVTVL